MKRSPTDEHRPSTRAPAAVLAALAALVSLVGLAAGCGSNSPGETSETSGSGESEVTDSVGATTAATAPVGSTPQSDDPSPTTTRPTGTSAPPHDDQTAAVVAALERLYAGFAAAANPPDPSNNLLIASATGELLASVQQRLTTYQADGTSGGGTISFEVLAVRVSLTSAEVDHCRLDSTFFTASDGQTILAPDETAVYVRSDLRLVDGDWRVEAQEFVSIDGETDCDLS